MRFILASIFVLSLATTACEPARRELVIDWTFNGGKSCADVGVADLEIDIGGVQLVTNQFACESDGTLTTGADLGRFLVGSYDIQLIGYDANSNPTYQLIQTIQVSASGNPNVIALDVPPYVPAQGGEGALTLYWSFNGKSCAAAGVSTVNILLDGTPITDTHNDPNLPCTQGSADGVAISPVSSGAHQLSLSAIGSDQTSYTATLAANVSDGMETDLSVELMSGAGGGSGGGSAGGSGGGSGGGAAGGSGDSALASLTWSFAGMTCAEALVDTVDVIVDGIDTGNVLCNNGATDGALIDVSAGPHVIFINAFRGTDLPEQVYATAGAGTTATFIANDLTHVIVSAASTSPGVGGATIRLVFPDGSDCSDTSAAGALVTYTVTSPLGVASAPVSFSCGGPLSDGLTTGITLCAPGVSGCPGNSVGLAPGLWSISATATGFTGLPTLFAVPNDAMGSATLILSATGGTGAPTATANLSWSFAGMSCADAQVDTVDLLVDGVDQGPMPCNNGISDGTQLAVTAGSHTYSLEAFRENGFPHELVYATSGAGSVVSIPAGTAVRVLLTADAIAPALGGASISFELIDGPDCSDTVDPGTTITYTLTDAAGESLAPGTFLCGGPGSSGIALITICDPGAPGCGGSNAGLAAGVWSVSATADGYIAPATNLAVPNDALGAATIVFTAQ